MLLSAHARYLAVGPRTRALSSLKRRAPLPRLASINSKITRSGCDPRHGGHGGSHQLGRDRVHLAKLARHSRAQRRGSVLNTRNPERSHLDTLSADATMDVLT
jgi:hypothetical protein